jgi:tripartite-type tricarboxylate transporter receptor subunit TctC
MKRLTILAALAAALTFSGSAGAQDWPSRTLTMVVPFAAGGPTDVLGRVMAQRIGEILGQQVIVENVGGAGGMTGSARVAQSTPDGYTFGLGTVGTHAQGQTLYKKPLYNAATDFAPVALIARVPIVLITRKDLPVTDFKEFVTYAKANQSSMQYGSAGAGSATHLGCVLLNYVIGVNITHVPYRGTGPAMQDLQGGRIDYLCEIITTAKPQIDGGSVKGIAIFDKQRSPALPNLPTAAEQGTQNLLAYTWNAIFLPKDTPEAIVKKLNGATIEAMRTPWVRERLEGLGAQIVAEDEATPQFLGDYVKSEIEKWAVPIKASGVSVDEANVGRFHPHRDKDQRRAHRDGVRRPRTPRAVAARKSVYAPLVAEDRAAARIRIYRGMYGSPWLRRFRKTAGRR